MGDQRFQVWKLKSQQASLRWQGLEVVTNPNQPARGAMVHYPDRSDNDCVFKVPQLEVHGSDRLDPYARGSDLIVRYPSSDQRIVGAELYWRWQQCSGEASLLNSVGESEHDAEIEHADEAITESTTPCGMLELIYSLETHLLDTRPDPMVQSEIHGQAIELLQAIGEMDQPWRYRPVASNAMECANACLITTVEGQCLLTVIPSDLKAMSVEQAEIETSNSNRGTGRSEAAAKRFVITTDLRSDFLEKGVIRRVRLAALWGFGDCQSELLAAGESFLNSAIPLTA